MSSVPPADPSFPSSGAVKIRSDLAAAREAALAAHEEARDQLDNAVATLAARQAALDAFDVVMAAKRASAKRANGANPAIDAMKVIAAAGYAFELRACRGLCSATWLEEDLWMGFSRLHYGHGKRTNLMWAAMTGNVARVRFLIRSGAPLEARNPIGSTALMYGLGHAHVVKALLGAGADAKAANNSLYTPLHYASNQTQDCVEIALALLQAGADLNARSDGKTPLTYNNNAYSNVDR